MKLRYGVASLLILTSMSTVNAQSSDRKPSIKTLPHIGKNGSSTQLFVDEKPYIMLAGELHNSSASTTEYMAPIWDKLAAMHLNTVISTVSWELIEPEEDKFDFTLVDSQITEAHKRNLHLVLIWFGSWKNGESTYAPLWVKSNHQRFPLQIKRGSESTNSIVMAMSKLQHDPPLSPLGEAAMAADTKAFRALMHHIKVVDEHHTVIMMQVENEIGLLGDSRDRSPAADAAWSKPVPSDLLKYLISNKTTLLPELLELWGRSGYKTEGTWVEVFGNSEWADEVFMAWNYARYINVVIGAGKSELNLPMYVNAWLGPQPGMALPGDWPSGGPVARVMDVWRAGAPQVDLFAPDIYADDFKGVCSRYARSGNPLFIPEARDQAGNLFWALGNNAALGWAVFGVDDLTPEDQISKSYRTLEGMLPELAQAQAANNIAAVLLLEGEMSQVVTLGGYKITVKKLRTTEPAATAPTLMAGGVSYESRAMTGDTRSFGLILNVSPDEFIFVGSNLSPTFTLDEVNSASVQIGTIEEGLYTNGKWKPGRRLNGDEGRPVIRPMQWIGGPETLAEFKVRLYHTAAAQ
ncbi:GH35 family beta-galactosidase [Granulicella arctica]|uniref:GH35 family beta-galactosidase n=1 Tax=Granulicella arctica TaxID=940613 RepID=UPI0021E087A5|nr:DUF5597 domain-containing protein [Granulicella arctica]